MFARIRTMLKKRRGRIYLDHAAATPVHPDVMMAMRPYFRKHFGNPSAIHGEGVYVRNAIDAARSKIARLLQVRASGVLFTGSGTESNNLAIQGLIRTNEKTYTDIEIISTKIEHPSVLRILERLSESGVTVHYAKLNEYGEIDETHVASLLSRKTALVTFAYANSETGTLQQVKRLTRVVRAFNAKHSAAVKVHVDASQAPLWLPCDLETLGADLMTLDAGKCYGPKGVGVLAVRHGVTLRAVTLGGDQEFGLRGGTENTPLIVGCAAALERAQAHWRENRERVSALRDDMIERLLQEIDGSVLNGSHKNRIANNVNISVPGIDSEFAVVVLDEQGIAASTQSACSGAGGRGSHVVREITQKEARAHSTIRFSLGEDTTKKDTVYAAARLKTHVERMQSTPFLKNIAQNID